MKRKHTDMGKSTRKINYSDDGASTLLKNDPKISSSSELQDEDIRELADQE